MRTIKFKAKCDKSGDWVIGDLIHGVGNKKDNMYILPSKVNLAYVKHCDPLDGVRVNPETIGQFTGISDKNGVEIYENDIVNIVTVSDKNRLIQFSKGCFEVVSINNRSIAYNIDEYYENEYEVIGNMFDNPELLQ